jgi:hypothetical protein
VRLNYQLKEMSENEMRAGLQELLTELTGIDSNMMTTTELKILHHFAANPPGRRRGKE